MDSLQSIRPRDRLLLVAELWTAATDRTLGALSSTVSNHGGTLDRLRDDEKAVTDVTLEKFAAFLVEAANWPGGEVPDEARAFAHVVGIKPAKAGASAGKAEEFSPERDAA